ncbi:MAG: hypothetical protein ABUK01_05380 [Leptospirales bacterium]
MKNTNMKTLLITMIFCIFFTFMCKPETEESAYKYLPGTYVTTQESGCHVTITLTKTTNGIRYKIKGKKIHKTGMLKIYENYLNYGDFETEITDPSKGLLTLQNYGNSMNPFHHIKECDVKYLKFYKQ